MGLKNNTDKKNRTYKLEKLFERIREIYDSKRNQGNLNLLRTDTRAHWRGTAPKKRTEIPYAPFTVELEPPLWALILDFNVEKYFTDPETYLEIELVKTIYKFENFDDSSCVGKTIIPWLGVPFEPAIFGTDIIYSASDSPWIGKMPVIKDENDLEKLQELDFYRSGIMPLAHRFYTEINEMLPEDFSMVFPEWEKSIFSVLWHIRGIENLLIDMYEKPDFVRRLFKRITDERKKWFKNMSSFLNEEVGPGNLLNDEVGAPVISPKIYEEFILPSEIELGNFHGGISYWHSCGNTTDFLKLIKKLPGLKLFHVSPVTDLETAVEEMGKNGIPLQICVDPFKDIHMVSAEEMEKKLKGIKEICGNVAYTVRSDGIQKIKSVDFEINKLKQWIEIAKKVLP